MRFKVVDIYDSTGDLECLGDGERYGNGDIWYSISPISLARVFGIDACRMSNKELIEALRGKEFHASLLPVKFMVRHGATPATDEHWKILDQDCERCESKFCTCAPKEIERVG